MGAVMSPYENVCTLSDDACQMRCRNRKHLTTSTLVCVDHYSCRTPLSLAAAPVDKWSLRTGVLGMITEVNTSASVCVLAVFQTGFSIHTYGKLIISKYTNLYILFY